MRMPMQGSCHSCTTFFPSLALPCPAMNPTYPYTAPTLPTSTRHPFDWRLAFFFPFLSCILAPADPVGYLSHVLRLHRERERTLGCTVLLVSLYLYLLLYIHISLAIQILCIRERHVNFPRVCYPYPIPLCLFIYLPSPASSVELYQPTTRHTPLAIHRLLIHSLTHSPVIKKYHHLTSTKTKKPWASPPQP